MPEQPPEASDQLPDDLWEIANCGTDEGWWLATGHCGGCGTAECHPSRACEGDDCRFCPDKGGSPDA